MASLEADGFSTLHDEERFITISDLYLGLLTPRAHKDHMVVEEE